MSTIGAILGWIVFGLIAGAIARLLVPGRQPMGLLMTMLLGIVGSLAGGLISWAFMGGPGQPFAPSGWIMSIIGAVLVLWIYLYFERQPGRV
jgi:uncharacterized membrane protein YeaQ/YmgE (transglycosylase-associated protein family)